VPLATALNRITAAPARVLGLEAAGSVAVGAVADLCVFDRHAHWRVEPRALKSQGHNTPFLGYELPAQVRATVVSGQLAYEQR
jgi:dihydroorotase